MKDLVEESYNRLMARIAGEALERGYRAGNRATPIAGWAREWHNCCYIDTPQGLVSWHYPDRFAHLFANLPAFEPATLPAPRAPAANYGSPWLPLEMPAISA
mgnify:CR=1 FL=1